MIGRRSGRAGQGARDEAALIDTAWRIHQAQGEWTSRVDTKAAFAFTIESAAIATTVALTAEGRLFSDLDKWWLLVLYGMGIGLLLCAAGLAAIAVTPRLRRKKMDREAPQNFIYFGHARLWKPQVLEAALRGRPILPQLTRQIVAMAEIAWVKHVRVLWSFGLAVVGAVCLVSCALIRTL